MALIRSMGFVVLVVDLSGSGRLRPQSPCLRGALRVVMTWCVGAGSVDVVEWKRLPAACSFLIAGIGLGRENIREERRSAPPGDTLRDVMVGVDQPSSVMGSRCRMSAFAIGERNKIWVLSQLTGDWLLASSSEGCGAKRQSDPNPKSSISSNPI